MKQEQLSTGWTKLYQEDYPDLILYFRDHDITLSLIICHNPHRQKTLDLDITDIPILIRLLTEFQRLSEETLE